MNYENKERALELIKDIEKYEKIVEELNGAGRVEIQYQNGMYLQDFKLIDGDTQFDELALQFVQSVKNQYADFIRISKVELSNL